MRCGLTHAPCSAAGAESAAFAAEGDEHLVVALLALGTQKAVSQDPAAQVLFELFDHEVREVVAGVANNLRLEGAPVLLDEFVESCLFGLVPLVSELLGCFFDHKGVELCKVSPTAGFGPV